MAEQSSGNFKLDELTPQVEAKNKEIESLKSEVLRLQLLLEKSQNTCLAPVITESNCENYELFSKLVTSTNRIDKGDQTSLCLCSQSLLCCNAETQTFETDFLGICNSSGSAEDWKPPEGSDCTVADLVKQVVDEASPQSDYVYDENYKMYYSPSTGYYYDMERNLLYDPHSGTYYSYDSQNNTYEFYYQMKPEDELHTELPEAVDNAVNKLKIIAGSQEIGTENFEAVQNIKVNNKRKNKAIKSSPLNNETVEIMTENAGIELKNWSTCCSMTIDEEETLDERELGSPHADSTTTDDSYCVSSVNSPGSTCLDDDISEVWPPCIRLIVEESNKLQIGSLLLITCTGAIVGRDKSSRLCIPDASVSKLHAEISYGNEACQYYVTDLGSQNGTFVNGTMLSQPKEKSAPHILKHGDHLCFGFCKLLVHIHPGTDTCDECEPGQVQAKFNEHSGKCLPLIQSKEEKEKERRLQLRQLKKKFGLENMSYEQDGSSIYPHSKDYQDRAKERQKTKGSDNPYEKTAQPASLDISIPSDNKGYQLLKSMGWKEGEALGVTTAGKVEPVPITVPSRRRAGLGASPTADITVPHDPRNRKWRKAQKRYSKTFPQKVVSASSYDSPVFEETEFDA